MGDAMAMKAGDTYVCENCGGTFESDWGEDEALAETSQLFGFLPVEDDRAVICDDCFKQFRVWAEKQGLVT